VDNKLTDRNAVPAFFFSFWNFSEKGKKTGYDNTPPISTKIGRKQFPKKKLPHNYDAHGFGNKNK